jgi:hypothetical protein
VIRPIRRALAADVPAPATARRAAFRFAFERIVAEPYQGVLL